MCEDPAAIIESCLKSFGSGLRVAAAGVSVVLGVGVAVGVESGLTMDGISPFQFSFHERVVQSKLSSS